MSRSRHDEALDNRPIARIGEIKDVAVPDELKIRRVAAIVAGRSDTAPSGTGLTTRGNQHSVDVRGPRRLEKNVPQLLIDRPIANSSN
jgi:hypothetical protein